MKEDELTNLAATILGGIIAQERASADERTLKRAIDLAWRLKVLVAERLSAGPAASQTPKETPPF